jgi:hypothetical protein
VLRLSKKQIETVAKIAADVGKLVIAILVLGNFVSGRTLHIPALVIGIVLSLFMFIIAVVIDR